MATWADILQSRANLDQVVKRTRNSLHLRLDDERTVALCVSPGGVPLHLRHPKTGLWVPAEHAQPRAIDRFLEWVHRPFIERLASPMLAMADFPSGAQDGYVYGQNAAYATARSTYSIVNNAGTVIYVGQSFAAGQYYCQRGFLLFDTSAITVANVATQVNLALTCTQDDSTTNFDVEVVDLDWSGQNPLAAGTAEAAFDAALIAPTDALWRNTNGMSINTKYSSLDLSTSWVEVAGVTYYALRSLRDFDGTTPTGSENITLASGSHATTAYRPVLSVLYTAAYSLGDAGRPITLVEYANPSLIPAALRPVAFITSTTPPDYVRKVKPTWVASPDLAAPNTVCYGAVKYATADLAPAQLLKICSG